MPSLAAVIEALAAAVADGRRLRWRDGGTQLQVTCPFHKGGREAHPSCTMRTDVKQAGNKTAPGTFYCFQCGETGWLAHYCAGWLGSEAAGAAWCRRFGWAPGRVADAPLPPPPPAAIVGAWIWEGADDSAYLAGRGIAPAVVRQFEVRETSDVVRFPVRDERGVVVGWQERSLRGKFFKNAPGWEKRESLYGLWHWQWAGTRRLVLCESIIDALTCWTAGWPAVATCGASVSERQRTLLRRSGARHIIVATDNDRPGERVWERVQTLAGELRVSRWPFLPEEHDVNSQTGERRNICWQQVTEGLTRTALFDSMGVADSATDRGEGDTHDGARNRIEQCLKQISAIRRSEVVSTGK